MLGRARTVLIVGQGALAMPVAAAVGRFAEVKKVEHILGFDRQLPVADCVIEMVGGVEPAFRLAMAALGSGVGFITANPMLMAAHGRVLEAAAAGQHAFLGCAAAGWDAGVVQMLRAGGWSKVWLGFPFASNGLLRRMAYRGESLEIAEKQLYIQRVDLSDMGGKVTQARAMVVAGMWRGGWQKASGVVRTGVDTVQNMDKKVLQGWGLDVVYGAALSEAGVDYVGPLAVALDSPLRGAVEREVLVAEGVGGQMVLNRMVSEEERVVGGIVAEVQGMLSGARHVVAPRAGIVERRNLQMVYCRVPYARRDGVVAEAAEVMVEQVDGDGMWQAVVSGANLGRLRMLAVDGCALPLAGRWQVPAAGLRLVG